MLITSVDQLTPERLTHILQQRGSLTRGHVLSIAARENQAAMAGPGFDSRNRIEISYSAGNPR